MDRERWSGMEWIGKDRTMPIRASLLPSPSNDFHIDRMRHSVYIDDLNIYGTDSVIMNAAIDQYIAAMNLANLPAKPSKVVRPSTDGVECLGVMVNGRLCEVGMSVPKLQRLQASTMQLLKRTICTGRQLAHVIGKWNWAMLIRRPLMSVFSSVYRFIECARDTHYELWPSVRRELRCAVGLAPLLYASINCSYAPLVIASDASECAAGVVFTNATSDQVGSLAAVATPPGHDTPSSLSSFITTKQWSTAIKHRWHREEHINGLEVRAALAAIRWCVKLPSVLQPANNDHRRVLLLVDSSATLGAINKGRSSAHRMLRPLRSMSAIMVAAGVYVTCRWIPSAMNPADRPSRLI